LTRDINDRSRHLRAQLNSPKPDHAESLIKTRLRPNVFVLF